MSSDSSDISPQLETWYARDSAAHLLSAIERSIHPLLDVAFGYHTLQIGPLSSPNLLADSPINHRIIASQHPGAGVGLICESDQLPLDSDSVDMLIALHALEFHPQPHQCLREMQRVLAPHGHLLVIGFNPYSLLGMSQWLRGMLGQPLWRAHQAVSQRRLNDWLNLVGCQVESVHHLGHMWLPGRRAYRGLGSRLEQWSARRNLPAGSVYVTHAIKQVPNVRPRPQPLRARRGLIGLGVVKPAATSVVPPPHSRDLAA